MKVSIITVSYNSSATILETILSVNQQSHPQIEHIFIDGDSTDKTLDIIKANSQRINQIISEKDYGIYDAMNKGIERAKGEIIFILNSDDTLYQKTTVEDVTKLFEKERGLEMVYGNILFCEGINDNEIKRTWKTSEYVNGMMRKGWHPPHPGLIVKKSLYNKIGSFNTDFKIAADFEFMLRAFEIENANSRFFNEFISIQKTGGASNTLRGILKGYKEINQAFKINNLKPIPSYFVRRYGVKLIQMI